MIQYSGTPYFSYKSFFTIKSSSALDGLNTSTTNWDYFFLLLILLINISNIFGVIMYLPKIATLEGNSSIDGFSTKS